MPGCDENRGPAITKKAYKETEEMKATNKYNLGPSVGVVKSHGVSIASSLVAKIEIKMYFFRGVLYLD